MILITTSHANRIEELIDVEIGNLVHEVHVCEIGFKDEKSDPLCVKGKAKVQEKCASTSSDCSMESSSEQVLCLHSENTGGSVGVEKDALKDVEKEAIKAMNVEKDYGFNCVEYSETSFRSLREKEILGNSTSPYLLRSFGNQEEVFGEDKSEKPVGINDQQVHVGRESGISKILDDVAELGTTPSLGFEEPINITCRVELRCPAEKETQAVKHANKKEDEKVTSDEVKMDVNAELKDAAAKGLVKDAGENLDPSASPKQDEEFMLKLFMEALTKMADEGKMDPKVLKDKLFPGGSATIDPKVKPEVVKALKDAIAETQKVERGGA
ncbi:hypothetical protein V6N13_129407 [Hibiscus sabdariffa]